MLSAGGGPGPLDYLIVGLAAVGFVAVMGLIALAVEPHYRATRVRLWRRFVRRAARPRDLGTLPSTWTPGQGERIRRLPRGRE